MCEADIYLLSGSDNYQIALGGSCTNTIYQIVLFELTSNSKKVEVVNGSALTLALPRWPCPRSRSPPAPGARGSVRSVGSMSTSASCAVEAPRDPGARRAGGGAAAGRPPGRAPGRRGGRRRPARRLGPLPLRLGLLAVILYIFNICRLIELMTDC